MVDKALQGLGLQRSAALPAAANSVPARAPRQWVFRLHAGDVLNTDSSGRSLALVARVYTLRGVDAIASAPPEAFDAAQAASPAAQALSKDVIAVRELTLIPGQKIDSVETLPEDAKALAVVALFRKPDAQRWRFVFSAEEALRSGLTLGAHGCALSVAQGQPLDTAPELLRLAGARCQP